MPAQSAIVGLAKDSSLPKLGFRDGGPIIAEDKLEDWSVRGLGQWCQLHSSTEGWSSPLGLEPFEHGGGPHLVLIAKNGSTSRERDCCAAKRLNLLGEVFDLEVEWGWESTYGQNGLRTVEFGLDTATASGARRLLKYRWGHYTPKTREGEEPYTRTEQLSALDKDGFYTQLYGNPTYAAAINENKADSNYFKGRFNVITGKYLGCIWGKQAFGCFNGAQSKAEEEAFAALEGKAESLPTFANGSNILIESRGRVDTAATESRVHITTTRLSRVS
jgi:hypothetical protein